MKPLLLDEIRKCIGARRIADVPAVRIDGVSTDSREVREGQIFFAIRGDQFDGHEFVARAFAQGAAAAVVERVPNDLPEIHRPRILVVDDVIKALGKLARWYRDQLVGTVIAVTGSNGKTTTKEMIYHLLRSRYRGRRAQKSFNNHIGVPLTLLSADVSDEFVVVEVGSNHPGEIDHLGGIVRPDIAIITGIAETHLEGFGSLDRIAAEKASLAAHVCPGGAVVVNGDHDSLLRLIGKPEATVIRFGQSENNDLRLTQVRSTERGLEFTVNNRFEFQLPVLGRHNAFNCLAAMAAARRMGLEMDQMARCLTDFRLPAMRLEVEQIGGFLVVNDAYNANPASMQSALEAFADLPGKGRRVFFCGQMYELGDDAEKYHRQLGRRIGCSGVNVLVAVGDYAPAVVEEAVSAGLAKKNARSYQNVDQAKADLHRIVSDGDVILVKGSRAARMESLVEQMRELTGSVGQNP